MKNVFDLTIGVNTWDFCGVGTDLRSYGGEILPLGPIPRDGPPQPG